MTRNDPDHRLPDDTGRCEAPLDLEVPDLFSIDASLATAKLLPAADATVKQGSPKTGFGNSEELCIGYCSSAENQNMRTWLRFDLGALPAGATIVEAKVWLHFFVHWNSEDYTAHSTADTWSQQTITWDNQPAFDPTPEATCPAFTQNSVWRTWDLTALARKAHATDGQIGFVLKGKDLNPSLAPPDQENYARSNEYPQSAMRPFLEVAHTVP